MGQQFLQSQSTLEMRAFSGQEFSRGQMHLTAVSNVWLPVIPGDTQHPPGCQLMWGLHVPLLHVCSSRKVNSSKSNSWGMQLLLAYIHSGRAWMVKPLQVSLKQLSPHCSHQKATFTIFRMGKENRNCIVRAHSRAAFTGSRSIAKMTRISFLPIICATF